MLRRSHILTAVAVLAMCIVPGFAYAMPDQPVDPGQAYQDLRSPDARDAAQPVQQVAQDLRSPDARDAAGTYAEPVTQVAQDLRSPDARDAAEAAKIELAQDLRSPDARDAALPDVPAPDTVVEIREVPSSGFDWGDAGIGAAGLLALLSIAGGLTLMVTTRRRRHGSEMPAH
jgi:hypothetical protein